MNILKTYICGLLMATILCACASQIVEGPAPHWQTVESVGAVGLGLNVTDTLDNMLGQLNTQSMLVIFEGRVLYRYGDVSDTGYIASIRKSVLGLLYGPYVESGEIRLNATLNELGIDDLDGLSVNERSATVLDLLTSRSGIYHPAANGGDGLADAPPRDSQVPGQYFLYNNWDFNAAGGIFEQQTGLSVYDALERDLALPLGFEDFDREYQELHGDANSSRFLAYHMFLSARDLARVGLLMLNDGRWNGKQLISHSWVQRITTQTTDASEMHPESQRNAGFDFGILWWLFDDRDTDDPYRDAFLAQGSYGQFMLVIPSLEMVIVHKTPYQHVANKEEYDNVAVSWQQFKRVADVVINSCM